MVVNLGETLLGDLIGDLIGRLFIWVRPYWRRDLIGSETLLGEGNIYLLTILKKYVVWLMAPDRSSKYRDSSRLPDY